MKSREFLKFKGQDLYFVNQGSGFFIAYRPICDALGIDHRNAHRDLKKHRVFGSELQEFPVLTTSNGVKQIRSMTCIPEKHVYLWIATLQSDSDDLALFQAECCEVLLGYFRGEIAGRISLLESKYIIEGEIEKLDQALSSNDDYIKLKSLRKEMLSLNKSLKSNDAGTLKHTIDLFNYGSDDTQV